MSKMIIIGLTILLLCINEGFAYNPPHAKVEPLYPKGIRISVPDEEGISLVAFHVKINDEFYSLEAGTIAVDIIKARNGRWTYQDKHTELKKYDVVYYWVHVVYKGLGYNLLDQEHKVVEFYNLDGSVHETGPATPTPPGSCQTRSETWVMERNTSQRKPCQGDLIFEEEFENLDANRWTAIEKFSGAPDYEFVVYQNSDKNVKVENGRLKISPTLVDEIYGPNSVRHGKLVLDRCTGVAGTPDCEREARGFHILPPVISGRMNTKQSFSFIYGRIEIRAKLPRGDWIYPLMSLESTNNANTGSFNELRVACASGNEELKTSEDLDIGNHVLWASKMSIDLNVRNQNLSSLDHRSNLQRRYSTSLWSDDYHNYEVIWSPNRIIFKVDGVQYGEQESGAPFDSPLYVNLGLAVGGHTEFPDMSRSTGYAKPWQNDGPKALLDFYRAKDNWAKTWSRSSTPLMIDYVKIWAL